MLKFIFMGWALLLIAIAPDSDTISADGFEETDMHISTDRPSPLAWSIGSTHSNAAVVAGSSLDYLSDDKIAKATRFTWDVGTPASTDFVSFTPAFTPYLLSGYNGVIAAFMPKTPYAVPPGVIIGAELTLGLSVVEAGGKVVRLNNGATAFVTVLPGLGGLAHTLDAVVFKVYNSTGATIFTGPTWATSGQTVDLGEIWFGSLEEFKNTMDPSVKLIDPTTNRRSHSNQAWALFQKPYKSWTAKFVPMDDETAFDSASARSFDAVRYDLASATGSLFLPRIYTPGTQTIDAVALNQLACFGRVDSLEALQGQTNARRWVASMTFSEQPP